MQRQRSGVAVSAVAFLALAFVWPFGGGAKERLTASKAVPGASAIATVGHDHNNNTTVNLHVRFLPPPGTLSPAQSVYVVWIQANGHAAQNKGQLVVNGNHQAHAKLRTPYRDFDLFVTAESSALATHPSGQRVISGRITRS
jgi:hypothetical protein